MTAPMGCLHRDQVQTFFKQAPKKAKRGWRRRRGAVPVEVRNAVFSRAGGWCEAAVKGVCQGRAVHPHHVLRRSQGGLDVPANLLAVCFACHRHIHDNPAWSLARGFLRSAS